MTTWPTSFPTSLTNWTPAFARAGCVADYRPLRGGEVGRAANVPSDKQQAVGMAMETIANVGAAPKKVSADAGYYSAKAVDDPHGLGVDPFIAPEQTRKGRVVAPAPEVAYPMICCPQGSDAAEATDQSGPATLRFADGNCGTDLRPDRTGPGFPAVSAAGFGAGPGLVGADLHRTQPAQAVPVRSSS